jgi:hypothetical protein
MLFEVLTQCVDYHARERPVLLTSATVELRLQFGGPAERSRNVFLFHVAVCITAYLATQCKTCY